MPAVTWRLPLGLSLAEMWLVSRRQVSEPAGG